MLGIKRFKEFVTEQKDEEEKWVIAFLGKMHKVAEINEDKVRPVAPIMHMIYHKDDPHGKFTLGMTRKQAFDTYRRNYGDPKGTKFIKADSSFAGPAGMLSIEMDDKTEGYRPKKPKVEWRKHATSGHATISTGDRYERIPGDVKRLPDVHNELSERHGPSDAAKKYSGVVGINEYMINQHTGGKAREYNPRFKDSIKKKPSHEQIISDLKDTISKHKLHKGLWLHTGISFNPTRYHDGESRHIHLQLPAFTSTSISSAVGQDFAGVDETDKGEHAGYKHTIHLYANSGTNAYYVGDHSTFPHEKEVILHPGARVRLKAKPKVNHERKEVHWHGKLVHDGIKDVSKPEPKPDFRQHF